uniref:Collagen type IV alpha-3-binding protein (inferred by orthology to a human protein) n=1 Tax=Strongyloides venezuelensis TaxID=75913 RepID=A0A0K0F4U2_STRVS
MEGILIKWTNYLNGWQERYFVVSDGVLYYFKSKSEMKYGIRGSMSLGNALIKPDRYDLSNFEIALNGAVWYLKAEDEVQRNIWVKYLNEQSGPNSGLNYIRKKEMEWRNEVPNNVDVPFSMEVKNGLDMMKKLSAHESNVSLKFCNLQSHVEELINFVIEYSKETNKQIPFVYNLKNELIDFKDNLCLLSNMVDDITKNYHTQEGITNKSSHKDEINEIYKKDEIETTNTIIKNTYNNKISNPSSPLSVLSDTEDEFFDTRTFTSDGEDNEGQLETGINCKSLKDTNNGKEKEVKVNNKMPQQITSPHDPLWETVEKITFEQLKAAKESVDEGRWELFTHSGAMKMYKMDVEIDGMICDPLKAYHYVNGVTAKEFLKYFYEFEYKKEWDDTLVKGTLVEQISPDLAIIHQLHKRIWPSAQRESLFWSHYRNVSEHKDEECYDAYIVCNHDIQRDDVPLTSSSAVRVGLKIAMFCQTVILTKDKPIDKLTRNDVAVKIVYVAQVNPGGWLPKAPLMQVYKREYPKFLKQFTAYVEGKIKSENLII